MAKTDTPTWIAVIAIIAIALYVISGGTIFEGAMERIGMGAVDADMDVDVSKPCLHVDDTTYTFTYADMKSAGTQPTEPTDDAIAIFVYNKAEDKWVKKDGTYASGDSAQLSPLSKVRIYNYDDAEDNAMTTANTHMKEFIVPCDGTLDHTIQVWDLGASAATTDGTWVILDDTYTSIKQTTGYDMSQGQGKTATLKYTYVADDMFGSPDGENCMVFQANKSLVKEIKLGGKSDQNCEPSGMTLDAAKGTDGEIWSFKIPVFESSEVYLADVFIELESGDLGAPVSTDQTHDVNITVFDSQYFYNADTADMELAIEDEDNNLLGTADLNIWFGLQ